MDRSEAERRAREFLDGQGAYVHPVTHERLADLLLAVEREARETAKDLDLWAKQSRLVTEGEARGRLAGLEEAHAALQPQIEELRLDLEGGVDCAAARLGAVSLARTRIRSLASPSPPGKAGGP